MEKANVATKKASSDCLGSRLWHHKNDSTNFVCQTATKTENLAKTGTRALLGGTKDKPCAALAEPSESLQGTLKKQSELLEDKVPK